MLHNDVNYNVGQNLDVFKFFCKPHVSSLSPNSFNKARFFLLVDFYFRFRVGATKKSSEKDQLTGHFQSFFFLLFLNISRTNIKTSKVTNSLD